MKRAKNSTNSIDPLCVYNTNYRQMELGLGIGNTSSDSIKPNKPNLSSNDIEDEPSVNCFNNIKQYLMNSTLHGLRYVGDAKLSIFERF